MSHAIAGFPEAYKHLADLVREMTLDQESLQQPLRRCDLNQCQGTCCHDGVYLSSEEARVIREISPEVNGALRSSRWSLPKQTVVYGRWREVASGPKTATREAPERDIIPDYPSHFPKTSCVFLLPDARCALQVWATERGLHPWYFKPLTCWLHPLSIRAGADHKPRLTLPTPETDPQRYEDYDGFSCRTHCGRREEQGEAAWKVLQDELEVLGKIGNRDLISELLNGSETNP
ncbi:MAG: DUF3109 family protein [Verrucomicrobiales bacterium]|nr:DUF3109 family protein [Verrucomicrobiales bacterium]